MKQLLCVSLLLFTTSAFAAEPTALELARVLQIKSVEHALAHVDSSIGQLAITYDFAGGMESAGYVLSINLSGRTDKSGNAVKDCAIVVDVIGPKYSENGQLNDSLLKLSRQELRTLPVTENSCLP